MLCLQNTSKGVLSTASSIPGGAYSSLYGIRVLSLLWIICGHLAKLTIQNSLGIRSQSLMTLIIFYQCFYTDTIEMAVSFLETLKSNRLYVISYSGPVFLAVDTFLLMGWVKKTKIFSESRSLLVNFDLCFSGLLSARTLLNFIKRADGEMNATLVARYLLNRIKRCVKMMVTSHFQARPRCQS